MADGVCRSAAAWVSFCSSLESSSPDGKTKLLSDLVVCQSSASLSAPAGRFTLVSFEDWGREASWSDVYRLRASAVRLEE